MTEDTDRVLQLLRDLELAQRELQQNQRALLDAIQHNRPGVSDARKKVQIQSKLVMEIISTMGAAIRHQGKKR